MYALCDLRGSGLAGADGPDRLIGDYRVLECVNAVLIDYGLDLGVNDLIGLACLELLEGLADAENGPEACCLGGLELLCDVLAALIVVAAALAVADNGVLAAELLDLDRGVLAGECALVVDVNIPMTRRCLM